ncbi:Sec-independent protein translocase protein TatB [Azospirillum sp. SYSU D00513]|uniref:Sec-independent protein translocase protein TatB n=1 Tax=Azospirillum sp. SYSU D00513 TaxID=2812561 RepID=UPI001A97421F|nr:Sec-independent protein translocase protein TatB [Azospirillum sp. SYSU D00513]
MLDIAWSELMVIAAIALVVIGPKDLPKAIYTLGKWVRKARGVAREFQTHIDDMMRESELDELRQQALKTRDMNLQKMMEDTVDPKGELKNAFNIDPNGGHPGSPPENGPDTAVAAKAEPSVQPLSATEPPVTAPATAPAALPETAAPSAPAASAPSDAAPKPSLRADAKQTEPTETDKQA